MKIVLAGPTVTSALRSSLDLQLIGAPPGYAQTPLAGLAQQLRSLGHEVTILTLDPMVDSVLTFQEAGVVVVYCPYRGAPKYRARTRSLDLFEREISYLTDEIARSGADIVHAHWTYEFAEAAVRSMIPHVVTMHDLGWEYFLQFKNLYRFFRLIMKYRTMPRVRSLSVVAPFMASRARQYGYFGAVSTIPNSVETPPAVRPISHEDMRAPCLVTVGNDGPVKNVAASIAAFRLIKGVLPEAQLHLFGPGLGPEFTAGEPGVHGHGNIEHARLMSYLADRATILVHPSRIETFGVILAEAKARSVPVVAGRRSGGVSYVCDDGVSALVDVNQPSRIAEAVLDLLSDPVRFRVCAAKSREDVATRFAPRAVAERYLAAYQHALENQRPRRWPDS